MIMTKMVMEGEMQTASLRSSNQLKSSLTATIEFHQCLVSERLYFKNEFFICIIDDY